MYNHLKLVSAGFCQPGRNQVPQLAVQQINHFKMVLAGFCQPSCWSNVVNQLVVQLINHIEQLESTKYHVESMYNHLKMVLHGFSASCAL